MQLDIRHGLQTAVRDYSSAPSVLQLKQDVGLRMELGFGDNVNVLVDGVAQPDNVRITSPSVTIETASNQKA